MNTDTVHTIYRCAACGDEHTLTTAAPAGSWVTCPVRGILVQIHTPIAAVTE